VVKQDKFHINRAKTNRWRRRAKSARRTTTNPRSIVRWSSKHKL